jgi:hypothetical protein
MISDEKLLALSHTPIARLLGDPKRRHEFPRFIKPGEAPKKAIARLMAQRVAAAHRAPRYFPEFIAGHTSTAQYVFSFETLNHLRLTDTRHLEGCPASVAPIDDELGCWELGEYSIYAQSLTEARALLQQLTTP